MIKTVEAIWDGSVLHLTEPIDLEPNTRLTVAIEVEANTADEESLSFIDTALSLNLEGPSDWATNFDDYLYGGKRDVEPED